MAGKVLLTGASGFIATYVFQVLLERGYQVVATVRSQSKADWLEKLNASKKGSFSFAFVPDIRSEGAFDQVLEDNKDIKYVIHTASPFFNPTEDPENQILIPAIKGTTNILEAIKKHAPQVEHVVITSSFAAIVHPDHGLSDPSITYTEKSWNPLTYEQSKELQNTYRGSKKLAEEVFWKFIKENDVKFKGTTINPPFVFGPPLQEVKSIESLNTSNAAIYAVLKSKPGDEVPASSFLEVDVRDVALAHVLALEKPESDGSRWFLTPGYFSNYQVLQVVKNKFPQLKIAEAPADYDYEKDVATKAKFDNSLTNKQSGIKYISVEKTLEDTIASLLDLEKQL